MRTERGSGWILMLYLLMSAGASRAETVRAVTHIHSLYSHNGTESLDSIAERVHQKGIDVFIPTDTLTAGGEFGLWPLRGLFYKRIERPSILSQGAKKYLDDIKALREKYKDMIIIPGTETAAYYRWSGNPWSHLTMVDWNRHMLILGLEKTQDYEAIPVTGNIHGGAFDALLLWPLGLFILSAGAWALFWRGLSTLFIILGVLFMFNGWPYRALPESPYDAETSWAAYQRVIDYANGKGAVILWAHPDAPNWQKELALSPKVSMSTQPYPEAIVRTIGHQGFGVFMEGLRRTAVSGGTWDEMLGLYLKGRRKSPCWAFAELDYHGVEKDLDVQSAQMVLEVKSKTAAGVLDAMNKGHFYSVRPDLYAPMVLRQWTLSQGERSAGSGETLLGSCRPQIELDVAYADGSSHLATVQIIRDGKVILSEQKALPNRWSFEDEENQSAKSFYRVVLHDEQRTWLVTNPIFCGEKT